jgi:hypothetical protein
VPRLVHLDGPPAIGRSTPARRYTAVAARAVEEAGGDEAGGDEVLRDSRRLLAVRADSTPPTVLHARAGDVEGTYAELRGVLG